MTRGALLLAVLLTSCTAPPEPVPIPSRLLVCPDPLQPPPPPRAPRTVGQLIHWTTQLVAWGDGNAALVLECRHRLDERNALEAHP